MARSVKKNPIYTDGRNGQKIPKRFSNKVIRRCEDIPNGKAYKKYYCSWNIHDYVSRWSERSAIEEYKNSQSLQKTYPTLKIFLCKYYYKIYRRK